MDKPAGLPFQAFAHSTIFAHLMKSNSDLNCWRRLLPSILFLPVFTSFHLYSDIFIIAVLFTPSGLSKTTRSCWQLIVSVVMKTITGMSFRHFKHIMTVLVLLGLILLSGFLSGGFNPSDFSAVERYGIVLSCTFYIMQSMMLINIPFFIFNFLGVVLLNVFTARPKLQNSPNFGPFLCFRVVTRGLFPDLVSDNVEKNLKICEQVGLQNYSFEVVSDIPLHLQESRRCREIVVPQEYKTTTGALFKARALQYSLEPGVNMLNPGDWIVHLDEETLLTEESVIGILNFASLGEFSFGQGVITYGRGRVVNWVTTLADSIRVGIDYGCLRFSLGVLHRPIFSWKGSFIVADAEAEMKISFDHGPEASIAEDCFFACMAFSKGYRFGFVEGEMLEKSTFTINDFIQQRRRWMRGILLTARSRKIPLCYKAGPILMSFSSCTMPINLLLWSLGIVWPMPMSPTIMVAYNFIFGTVLYLFILGTLQTFGVRQYGLLRCSLLVVATMLCGLVACILENISSVLVFWTPTAQMNTFYVVNKESHNSCFKII